MSRIRGRTSYTSVAAVARGAPGRVDFYSREGSYAAFWDYDSGPRLQCEDSIGIE